MKMKVFVLSLQPVRKETVCTLLKEVPYEDTDSC